MKSILLSSFLLMVVSLSAQWDRQYPFNHIGIINDININGDFGAAVGDDATIFITNDGGTTWSIKDNDLIGWNFATVERAGDLIYACGRGIYKSDDGGETFQILPNAPSEIFDSYLSPSGALIVSNNSGVYKSTDQGLSFNSLETPTDSLGYSGFILDENHIWWATVGSDPVLYITTDGGENWTANQEMTRPRSIAFYDENIGVAASLPYMYYTEDGGNTWEERGRLSRYFGKIIFGSSPEIGYLSSSSNLYITYDGFQTFTEIKNILPSSDLNGLHKIENGPLLVGASYSSIAATEDEGVTWTDISGSLKPSITAMVSTNGQDVYAAGKDYLLSSSDGGENWEVFDSIGLVPQEMIMMDDNNIILSGIQKIVQKDLVSKEESTILGPRPGIFEDFHITPSGRWIAYSSLDYYLLSDDQGITWDSVYLEKFSNGIDMMENGDLFLRIRGKVLFSDDEGDSWKEVYTANTPVDIVELSAVDSIIYIAESLKSLRKSNDYGATWDSLATPTGYSMIVSDMHFINQDTGYIYDGGEDRLWYTYDGGKTWPFSYYPKARINGIYEFSNDDLQSVWLYGLGGFIEKQSDCRNAPLLSTIEGERFPCLFDTITYSVNGSNIDNYVWTVPAAWVIVGDDSGPELSIYATDPGVGYLTVYGENACGNTDALDLQIAATAVPEVVLVNEGDFLRTDADGDVFQWYKDGVLITGANVREYSPTESGEYTVLVTFSSGCSRWSNAVGITVSSIHEWSENAIQVFPNPSKNGRFYIKVNGGVGLEEIRLIDVLGRPIRHVEKTWNGDQVEVILPDHAVSGLYFVQIQGRDFSRAVIVNR